MEALRTSSAAQASTSTAGYRQLRPVPVLRAAGARARVIARGLPINETAALAIANVLQRWPCVAEPLKRVLTVGDLDGAVLGGATVDSGLRVFQALAAVGLSDDALSKVLLRYPQILAAHPDEVQEVLTFLQQDVGLGPQALVSVVTRFPQVFSYGVKAFLRPQLAYLKSLGVEEGEIPRLVEERPLVLGEGIDTVVNFLCTCGVRRKEVFRLIGTYPIDYSLRFRMEGVVLPPTEQAGDAPKNE